MTVEEIYDTRDSRRNNKWRTWQKKTEVNGAPSRRRNTLATYRDLLRWRHLTIYFDDDISHSIWMTTSHNLFRWRHLTTYFDGNISQLTSMATSRNLFRWRHLTMFFDDDISQFNSHLRQPKNNWGNVVVSQQQKKQQYKQADTRAIRHSNSLVCTKMQTSITNTHGVTRLLK